MKKSESEAVDTENTEQEDEEYAVEKICGRRVRKGRVSAKPEPNTTEQNRTEFLSFFLSYILSFYYSQ